ncbi:hypothetical protein [Nostoc sp.]|uniref:hypothetical protein n=1 Tax=Nostoc sp. TaxID=1180 RepID=UPI002FF4AEBB
MKLNLIAEIPRQKATKASREAADGKGNIYLIGFFIISLLMICFGKSLVMVLAGLIILGYFVVGLVISYLQDWIEPRFFIERSFKVHKDTRNAEFHLKNYQWYLTLVNENNIEIFDVKSGNIIANLKEGNLETVGATILFSPSNKFIFINKFIQHKGEMKYLIQMWNINTSSLVFNLISENNDMNNFIFHKNEKLVFYTPRYCNSYHRDDETYTYNHSLIVWETKNGQIMCNECLDSYRSFNLDEKELKSKINNCLKSHKELGELIDYQYPLLDEADNQEVVIEPYPTQIIFPSCTKTYSGAMHYDLTKLKEYIFTEKATCIIVKIPLKEIK